MDKVEKARIMREIYFRIFSAICIVVCIVASLHNCNKRNHLEEELALEKSAKDSLVKKKNKDGSETNTISLLQARNSKLVLEIQTKDATIRELQEEVKKNKNKIKNGGSVTVINSETTFSSTASTTVESSPVNDSICDPVYVSRSKDSTWIGWSSRATKDSTTVKFKSKDKYSVVIGSERVNLFKHKPIVEVTTFNPYNSVKTLRAFEVTDNTVKKRITLGIQVGGGFLIKNDVRFGGYIGVGIGYTFLSL